MNVQGNVNSDASTKSVWARRLKRWLIMFGSLYIGLIVLLAVSENYLVYPGSSFPRGDWDPEFAFEEIEFESSDGTKLVGWFLPCEGATETVLVCHGNAENVSQSARHSGLHFQDALNANVFLFDYRGYGKSEGSPHQQGVLNDSEAAMKVLNLKTGTRPQDVIVVGHSIGGGPAVYLASTMGAKALFLQRTFSSLVEPAARQYWFVPVNLIMRNRFPNSDWIKDCHVPLHQSHGDRDGLVPIESGRKLFDSSPATIKQFWTNEGNGHWDAMPHAYWNSVTLFVDRINSESKTNRAD